eukprot:763903-Hanusia_phi.AAC.1
MTASKSLSTSSRTFSSSATYSSFRFPSVPSIVEHVTLALIFIGTTRTTCPSTSSSRGLFVTSRNDSGGYSISCSPGYCDRNARSAPRSIAPQLISNTVGCAPCPAYSTATFTSPHEAIRHAQPLQPSVHDPVSRKLRELRQLDHSTHDAVDGGGVLVARA